MLIKIGTNLAFTMPKMGKSIIPKFHQNIKKTNPSESIQGNYIKIKCVICIEKRLEDFKIVQCVSGGSISWIWTFFFIAGGYSDYTTL